MDRSGASSVTGCVRPSSSVTSSISSTRTPFTVCEMTTRPCTGRASRALSSFTKRVPCSIMRSPSLRGRRARPNRRREGGDKMPGQPGRTPGPAPPFQSGASAARSHIIVWRSAVQGACARGKKKARAREPAPLKNLCGTPLTAAAPRRRIFRIRDRRRPPQGTAGISAARRSGSSMGRLTPRPRPRGGGAAPQGSCHGPQ